MIVASGNEYRIVLTQEAIDSSIDSLQRFLDLAEQYGYKRPEDTVKIRVAIETMMAYSAEHFGDSGNGNNN